MTRESARASSGRARHGRQPPLRKPARQREDALTAEDNVAVSEREAADMFTQMAQRLMKNPHRKRPMGMPERRTRS